MAQQTQEIAVLDEAEQVSEQVLCYRSSISENIVILAELGGGALRFARAAFPDADTEEIYAQQNQREAQGRGPHFDIYGDRLVRQFRWLGVYNLDGRCDVSASLMPKKLASEYKRLYPEPNAEAREARRHFGAILLDSPVSEVYTGSLEAGTGMILPQPLSGPPVVHEVAPKPDSPEPGSFMKIIVPKQTEAVLDELGEQGFMPIDELLTQGAVPSEERTQPPRLPGAPRRASTTSSGVDGSTMLD